MKTYIYSLFALVLLASCQEKKAIVYGDAMSEGTAVKGRKAYEHQRLADPETGRIPLYMRELELEFASHLPGDHHYNAAAKGSGALNWVHRGPWNVGGRTRAFAMDVTNPSVLVAGAASGGMWRSTDGGLTWTRTSTLSQHQSVTCVVQDSRPGHEHVWYYGTGEAYGQSASADGAYYIGYGIYKSTDSAKTWTALPSTITTSTTGFDVWGDVIWDIAIDPSDTINDMVFAASYGGIYKSLNGGTSWILMKGNLVTASQISYFTDIEVTSDGVIYCSFSSDGFPATRGIWRSTDAVNFANITPANFPPVYNRLKIGVAPSDESQVYILGNTPGYGQPDTNYVGDVEWNSLWKYHYLSGTGDSSGGEWFDLSMNLPTDGGSFDKFSSQGSYNVTVRVKPNDTNVVFIGGTNLYRSTDAFKSPGNTAMIGGYEIGTELPIVNSYPNHHSDQHEILFDPNNPDIMYSGNDGGVFKTNDNMSSVVTWTPLNTGYITTQFYTCAIDHATTSDIIIGGMQDNGTWFINSANPTDPWTHSRGGDGSYCAIADNEAAYYFSIQNGKMMKATVDANGVIDSFARIDPIGGEGYDFINPYILDPNNNNIMYLAGGRYLWRNDDLSGIPYMMNWDTISINWTKLPDTTLTPSARISCIAVSKNPANRVYYGTNARRVYRLDNANSANPVRTDITAVAGTVVFPGAGSVSSIAVDPNDADKVIVAYSNYNIYSLFYSEDAGVTWSKIGGNLEANINGTGNGPSIRWVSIMPVTGGNIYWAGTSTGLYATSQLNGTATVWVQQGVSSIGNMVVDMIDHRNTDGLVLVATHGNGAFTTHVTHVNDIVSAEEADITFAFNCYPNPASDHITLNFELFENAATQITVYDMNGNEVRSFSLGTLVGEQRTKIERNRLKAGVYYVRVTAGKQSYVRKIVFV